MRFTVKSTRIIKEGERKDGTPYKWVSVMAEDGGKGTEYTTFDSGVLKLGAGAVIDIGDVTIKEGKLSFKKVVSVVSEGTLPAPAPANGKPDYGMTPELWVEKDKREQWSRECNTCFMGIVQMQTAEHFELPKELIPKYHKLLDAALDWALARLDKPAPQKPSEPPERKSEGLDPALSNMVFETAGELKNYLKDVLKPQMTPTQIAAATAGFVLTTPQDRKACWASILKTREAKPDEIFEPDDIPF